MSSLLLKSRIGWDSLRYVILNHNTFPTIFGWHLNDKFISIINSQIHAYCDRPDIILVGNKADLRGFRIISESQARDFAEKNNLPYIETSVYTGENVQKSFDMLLDLVMNRMEDTVYKAIAPPHGKSRKLSGFRHSKSKIVAEEAVEHKKETNKTCICM